MVKVTVVNFKNHFKYIRFIVIFLISLLGISLLCNLLNSNSNIKNNSLEVAFISCLDENIPGIKSSNTVEILDSDNILETILYSELPLINKSFLISNVSALSSEYNTVIEEPPLEYAADNVNTEVIANNVPNTFTNDYNGVEIKNSTDYELTEDILNPSSLDINKSDIIIFHTHTCESYTPSDLYQYEASGNFRTIDLERSVSKVGSELTTYLLSYGYNVLHDTTYHDYPAYTGSYDRSMSTVKNLLISKPNTDIIIDLHRDAIGDTTYSPSVKIGDEVVSQLMFVIGTDGGGLEHPNWKNNLKFAITVQEKANELYPGLFKPIILRNSRYNQQLGNASCIIEVGATGNTLEQSLLSMKYLSRILDEVLKNC